MIPLLRFLQQYPDFTRLWGANAISNFGDKFNDLALPIVAYQITGGSALHLGLITITETVAHTLFGLIAGSFSDRWPLKKTLLYTHIIRACLFIGLAAVVVAPLALWLKLALMYTFAFLSSVCDALYVPAKVSFIPEVVPSEQLMTANSLDQSTSMITRLAGYAVAGIVVTVIGGAAAFLVDALTFVVAALLVLGLVSSPKPQRDAAEESSLGQEVIEGIRFTWRSAVLRYTTIISMIAPAALGAMPPLLLVISNRLLDMGNTAYVVLITAYWLGLSVGVLVARPLVARVPHHVLLGRALVVLSLASAAFYSLMILAGSRSMLGFGLGIVLIMIGAVANGMIPVSIRGIVQTHAPKGMMGRAFTLINTCAQAAIMLGQASIALVDLINIQPLLVFWGVFLLLASVWGLRAVPSVPQEPQDSERSAPAQSAEDSSAA